MFLNQETRIHNFLFSDGSILEAGAKWVRVSETNSAPENGLLEDYLSLLRRPVFQGPCWFREGMSALGWLGI